jgi:hypothetical protein
MLLASIKSTASCSPFLIHSFNMLFCYFLMFALLGNLSQAGSYGKNVTVSVSQTAYEDEHPEIRPRSSILSTESAGTAQSHFNYARNSPTTKASPSKNESPTLPKRTPSPSISVAPSDNLLPSVHPDQDTHAISNLQPSKECTLYYEAKTVCAYSLTLFLQRLLISRSRSKSCRLCHFH